MYFKDFGLDKSWNPQWLKVKMTMDRVAKATKLAKQQSQPCAQFTADSKAIIDEAMDMVFSTPQLNAVRQ